MKEVSFIAFGLALASVGCATSRPIMFGMAVNRIEDGNRAFTQSTLNPDNSVSYTLRRDLADDSVTARLENPPGWLMLDIQNAGRVPISLNYFSDHYYLHTTASRTYELRPPDILRYPQGLNPGENCRIEFLLPGLDNDERINLLVASINYGHTQLVLKAFDVIQSLETPKPTPQPQAASQSEKFCPIGGERYPASTARCPKHGVELKVASTR